MTEEIWKPVVGHEGLYEVSNLGRVRALERMRRGVSSHSGKEFFRRIPGKVLSPAPHSAGYLGLSLTKAGGKPVSHLIHRLVAEAFLPNPKELRCVNHIDANKKNNHVTNLEWCTFTENYRHAAALGLFPDVRGSRKGSAKLQEDEVFVIKKMIQLGFSNKELAAIFKVSTAPISYIRNNQAWTHVPW